MNRNAARVRRGITLLEILIVVAILAVLCSLTLTAAANSKREAKATADVSNLRQIGQALEMYITDNDGLQTKTVDEVVSSGLLDAHLLVSPNDPTSQGYGNLIRQQQRDRANLYVPPPAPFKLSYVSRLDADSIKGHTTEEALPDVPRKGWLIVPTHGKWVSAKNVFPDFWQDGYLRLCNDGSVVRRRFLWRWIDVDGHKEWALSVDAAFEDRPVN